MRRFALMLLMMSVAVPARGAPSDKPRRRPVVPPSRIAAPAPPTRRRQVAPPPPLQSSAFGPEPVTRLSRLGAQGATGQGPTGQGLARLGSAADGAPVCRSDCAARRYTCLEQYDESGCTPVWTRCLLACRGR